MDMFLKLEQMLTLQAAHVYFQLIYLSFLSPQILFYTGLTTA